MPRFAIPGGKLFARRPNLGALTADAPAPVHLSGRTPTVLAFHGFGGTTREVELCAEVAGRVGLAARATLLPGHGSHARDLAQTRFKDWQLGAEQAFAEVAERGPVIVVGPSLGSLLAAHLAASNPGRVAGLVLLANALWLRAPFPAWALRAGDFLRLPDFMVPRGPSDIADDSTRNTQISYTADPVHAAMDVERGGRRVRAELGRVCCPTLILHGARDRVCPVSNAWRAAELLGTSDVRVVILPRSHHIVTRDVERTDVARELAEFYQRVSAIRAA